MPRPRLPLAPEPVSSTHRILPRLGEAPLVLVVDDDALVRSAMARAVATCARVLVAEGFATALALVKGAREPLGAAIVDIGLRDGSGLELARRLHASAPTLPILLVTGDIHATAVNAAQELHVEIVAKPLVVGTLTDFVERSRAGALGARIARATESYARATDLTPAEEMLVSLAVQGVRSGDLSARLGVTPGTVKSQVTSVLFKTREHSLESVARVVLLRALALR
ncbi:MAG: response regulator [Sandaracinus sp.]